MSVPPGLGAGCVRARRCVIVLALSALAWGVAGPARAAVAGLVAAYGFEEASGPTVSDQSGNANHGTIVGASRTSGRFGSGLSFSGSSLVNVPDSSSLDLTTGMTLEAWVFPTTVNSGWADVVFKAVDIYYLESSSPSGGVPGIGGTFAGSPLYGP